MEVLKTELRRVADLVPYAKNAKEHDKTQIANVAKSIEKFGFVQPVVIDKNNVIVIGHCRVEAAKKLKLKEVPCVCVENLTEEQVNALRLVDNKTNESEWNDFLLPELEEVDLSEFDFDWLDANKETTFFDEDAEGRRNLTEATEESEAFEDKFKPKRTTDDCYTPDWVYQIVSEWVEKQYGVDRSAFVRPFYPNGNYQKENYENKIVVDNPPFSIESEIVRWYSDNGIKFFLFCSALTPPIRASYEKCATIISTGVNLTFENGADISVSFVTNMEGDETILKSAPDLYKQLSEEEKKRKGTAERSIYKFPMDVVTCANISKYSIYGIDFSIAKTDATLISSLTNTKTGEQQAIFGNGYLLSKEKTEERKEADREIQRKEAEQTICLKK